MKLIEREIGIEIEVKENTVSVLVIENVELRLSLIEELHSQMLGKEGNWLLSENEKTYDLAKHAELLLEPFSLQLNSKKVKTKLFQELKNAAEDFYYSQGLELHSQICSYLEMLMERVPYPLRYENEWSLLELLKCYNVELLDEGTDACERLFHYIKLMNLVCGTTMFIMVNMKQYLSKKQLTELYKLAQYTKIQLVLIEFNLHPNEKHEEEDVYIIDKDNCIIIY